MLSGTNTNAQVFMASNKTEFNRRPFNNNNQFKTCDRDMAVILSVRQEHSLIDV